MKTLSESTAVINAFTEKHDWLGRVEAAMKDRSEIVLLLRPAKDAPQEELQRLCGKYHYSSPMNLPNDEWPGYKAKLNLSDLALQEQSITPEMIHLLKPL